MRGGFKLLVFDWDGTLMDSEAQIVSCIRASLVDLDEAPLSDAAIRNIIGLGLTEAIETLMPGRDGAFHKRLVERYRHHFLSPDSHDAELFAGAADTLHALRARGYVLAVATGKGRAGLNRVLRDTGLTGLFEATRCADETASKPHPQMLLELMNVTGVDAGATLMIGDTEYDMAMARSARTAALAVAYGVHERERLMSHAPLGCIDAILELPDWLADHDPAFNQPISNTSEP
jgi:phosphoglycolate phosphatase